MSDVRSLSCPVDGKTMVRQQHGVGQFHACTHCRGLWIPRTYLLALKRRAAQQLKRKDVEPVAPRGHEAQLQCPECAGDLLPRMQQSVPIDVCGQCRAVWLDGDEILEIARAEGVKERREAELSRRRDAWSDRSTWDGEVRDPSMVAGALKDVLFMLASIID